MSFFKASPVGNSSKKNRLGAFSISNRARIILVIPSFAILFAAHKLAAFTPHAVIILNIPFFIWWLYLGPWWGLGLLIFSSVLSLSALTALRPNFLAAYSVTFFLSQAAAYVLRRQILEIEQASKARIEKLEGDANELNDKALRTREESKAMEVRLDRLSRLGRVLEQLSSTLSEDRIAEVLLDSTSGIIEKADRSLLYLVDTANQELRLLHSKRPAPLEIRNASKFPTGPVLGKKGDIFDRWVLKQRNSLIVEDIYNDFRFAPDRSENYDFTSIISTPLMGQNKVLGVLRMDSPEKNRFTQEDLRLLDIVADLGAAAVQNAILYKRVEDLAITDSLTGLYVHKYFRERLKKEIDRSHRSGNPFSILIIDIDDFKAYNDKYGHVAGDLVLKHIAAILKNKMRAGDIASRYGGEEFALILLKTDKRAAIQTGADILDEVRARPLILRRSPAKITASIGIAGFPEDAKVEEDVIKCADNCLYKAKLDGKDKVFAK